MRRSREMRFILIDWMGEQGRDQVDPGSFALSFEILRIKGDSNVRFFWFEIFRKLARDARHHKPSIERRSAWDSQWIAIRRGFN